MSLANRAFAELIGTAGLLTIVVGSGIAAADLASEPASALMANAIATGAGLYVLITALGPISGAHFNPSVTLAFALAGELRWRDVPVYVLAQVAGACLGVWTAHLMFDLTLFQWATNVRDGSHLLFSELIATGGLLATIFLVLRGNAAAVPACVGAYITAAYWFTASTSFANPAVTLARTLTDTFAGIRTENMPLFVAVQLGTALLFGLVWRQRFRSTALPQE